MEATRRTQDVMRIPPLAALPLAAAPLLLWREVFARIQASPFCRGEDGGWKADIDWALRPAGKKPETALKVLEGAYDRSGSARGPLEPQIHGEGPIALTSSETF